MIVHPDFLDHWKTKKLVELLEDPGAPLLILRLWAYCQKSKKSVFEKMDPFRLKSVCHAQIDGDKLMQILTECGFVRIEEGQFVVHDWEQVNRSLFSSWNNGRLGGRPETHGKPSGNPQQTHGKPAPRARVREEDKIRAGYPVGFQKVNPGDQPAGNLASPETGKEEKPDPANVAKFGADVTRMASKPRKSSQCRSSEPWSSTQDWPANLMARATIDA